MKKAVFVISICAVLLIAVLPFSAFAGGSVDPAEDSSLTLQYKQQGIACEGLNIKTYQVAELSANGHYQLTDAFADYPVSLDGVTTQSQWNDICSTLSAYISADQRQPTYQGVTDQTGTVCFEHMAPGMYLTLSVKVKTDDGVSVFYDFITAVPGVSDAGDLLNDVTVYPKWESYPVATDPVELKVVKQWKDAGNAHNRPEQITVDIYKDGALHTTQTLSGENNWAYRWFAPDDGSNWQAVERRVAQGYTVAVAQKGNTLIITNAYHDQTQENPTTGDTALLWPYVLTVGVSGGLLVVLALCRKRAEE